MMTRNPGTPGLLERLEAGLVLSTEGYLFELERGGYIQAGALPQARMTFRQSTSPLPW
jgi:hypothetical protein